MSLIKNLIKEPEIKNKPHYNKKKKKGESAANQHGDDAGGGNASNDEEDKPSSAPRPIIKTATDLQRLKIEKLMRNPDKPIHIPETRHEKDYLQSVPTFVRNVMGSSAGAGSGEFHVYRHLRRKEYARQKMIQIKSHKEQMDEDFQRKLEENQKAAEEKTAKKRAKRLKKKQHKKMRKNHPKPSNSDAQSQPSLTSSDEEEEQEKEGDDIGKEPEAGNEGTLDDKINEQSTVPRPNKGSDTSDEVTSSHQDAEEPANNTETSKEAVEDN